MRNLMELIKNNVLVAVSGGPDSMFLLNYAIKMYGSENIIVATMNYNTRSQSQKEVELVRTFCESNMIYFELKSVKYTEKNGNFEDWARIERYSFFSEVYKRHNCDLLLLGHHKDDFIETVLMQVEAKKQPLQWGMKKHNILFGMNIYRPFLDKYWKFEIENLANTNSIPYLVDESNFSDIYTRNKIRAKISGWNIKEKELFFEKYYSNLQCENTQKTVENEYEDWKKSEFSQDSFSKYTQKKQLFFMFIHKHFLNIKLSTKKLESIIQWYISKNRTGKYLIKNNIWLIKKQGKLKH
ncbi:tRNA(Ile)-lysidine synthase [Mycoplasmopsis californica HAZ160_1]|uniref:tRNA(Ile)-lysidine synthase n=2 Tax=Mycoplasmopsis californica TaxID=2113 RepID=A0AAT9F7C1_9BACT|nr:tRNA(Ile)-lysidine synthase [Mycoplasmopsis californica HAZ160_1]BBG40632.1 tRNA(Ile)-lysidine synthase [Mycoplasmopsis californica]BBG41820.1 tRNA(Ile)-lysidine synthase [Mycoplasmopsis californica]BBG42414.1 tRNA(Ile)-lysidine synthase [Mycoplasmopsis californica]BBG42988.1 tRNA(Ile)-lysidine synthase [Mycoplasmopsis californica]